MRHVRMLFFVVGVASPLFAQERLLSGKVVTSGDLGALPGVTVSLVPQSSCDCSKCPVDCKCCPTSFATVTDADGTYSFKNIPEGGYSVLADLSGLKAGRELITIDKNMKVVTDFQMAWDSSESIMVTAEAPLVDVSVNTFQIGGGADVYSFAAVIREKGCSCRQDCPEDPKCDCCLAFFTRFQGGRFDTRLPAGKEYELYLAKPGGASETQFKLDLTETLKRLNIPVVRDPASLP